jgi:hypothetical protein
VSLRAQARAWLHRRGRQSLGALYTSKYYVAEQSWTGAEAWWIQIPLKRLGSESSIDAVCESKPDSTEFRHLRIPTAFLRKRLADLAVVGDSTISLFLSAEPKSLFVDKRGRGRVDFRQFEQ